MGGNKEREKRGRGGIGLELKRMRDMYSGSQMRGPRGIRGPRGQSRGK